jgi:hypothetical protein
MPMSAAYNDNLLRTLRLTREMLALADEGDRDRNDDSCGVVYGVLRDTAYRVRTLAEKECDKHKRAGKWEALTPGPGDGEEPLAEKGDL